jgi:hypothetical protein
MRKYAYNSIVSLLKNKTYKFIIFQRLAAPHYERRLFKLIIDKYYYLTNYMSNDLLVPINT